MTPRSEDHSQSNDTKKENILMKMVKQKKWSKALSFLITDYGRDIVTHQDEFDNTLLHIALGYQAPEDFLIKLIEIYPEATQVKGVDDWLPLHVAAMWGCNASVMEAIIREYPEALDVAGEKGRTPRHFSKRFAHNTELLERTTEEWLSLTRVKRQKSKW
jgi:ankyrin repeat protein